MPENTDKSPFANSGKRHVEEGMHVYGSDGKELGTVGEVWPENSGRVEPDTSPEEVGTEEKTNVSLTSEDPGFTPEGSIQTGDFSAASGIDISSAGEPTITGGGGYFKVNRGHFLGIGGRDLYIPYGAIASTDDGIRLNVTSDEAGSKGWHQRPIGT